MRLGRPVLAGYAHGLRYRDRAVEHQFVSVCFGSILACDVTSPSLLSDPRGRASHTPQEHGPLLRGLMAVAPTACR